MIVASLSDSGGRFSAETLEIPSGPRDVSKRLFNIPLATPGVQTQLQIRAADLLEGHGHAGDAVVVRSALQRREDGEVDLVLQVVHDLLPLLVR